MAHPVFQSMGVIPPSQGKDCKNRTDEICKENNFLVFLHKGMWWGKIALLPTHE